MMLTNLFKYPAAAVMIFFTVKAGIGPSACFCAGFSLVYLVLVGLALASLRNTKHDTEGK